MKEVLSGNEAIARGAFEAGCKVAMAYPGTPSTEILQTIADNYKESIYCAWGSNEKTAFETALGSSIAGVRSLVAMKHVGLNVAADPLFTAAYTGVGKGFIIITADDPSNHSSQNEQDNRWYGIHSKVPVLEPSDSQECIDFVKYGFELSEKFDVPVIIRLTTRVSHSKSICNLSNPLKVEANFDYKKNVRKYIMVPSHSNPQHVILEKKLQEISKWSRDSIFSKEEILDTEIGIVTSGLTYQYVKEVFPNYSILKLGLVYPVSIEKIKKFRDKVKKLYFIEELEPILEFQARMADIKIDLGKNKIPNYHEFSVERLKSIFFENIDFEDKEQKYNFNLPPRPPVLCAGCPHRATFYNLGKKGYIVHGDIGCYTLGFADPLNGMDTTICMGASITMGNGFSIVNKLSSDKKKVISIIGESTFMHSGLTGTVDAAYNNLSNTIIVLDNSVTAMTGHQDNPMTGKTLMGENAPIFDIKKFAEAANIKKIDFVDGYYVKKIEELIEEHVNFDGPSMIVVKKPCVLKKGVKTNPPLKINQEKCKKCKMCLKIGCPAISLTKEGNIVIDETMCAGCTVCYQVCSFHAIEHTKN